MNGDVYIDNCLSFNKEKQITLEVILFLNNMDMINTKLRFTCKMETCFKIIVRKTRKKELKLNHYFYFVMKR
jgi:hypothetical protein